MQAALLILPNFVLILVGLLLARRFDYGRDFWSGLEKLVYYVLFPALLFRSLAVAKIDLAQTGRAVAIACAFTIAGFALSLAAKPLFRLDQKFHAATSQCGYRFNTYIGLAIAGSLFGNEGVALAALLLGAMIPLANFGAVAVLASQSERGFLVELVQHPLVVSSLAGFARALGLSGIDARVLVLCAALPTATNAYILAVRMTGDGRAVATQITIGTVLSMATIPAWIALV